MMTSQTFCHPALPYAYPQAHGVYEGSYWTLLAELSQLEATLQRMTKAPPLIAEPVLQLPPSPPPLTCVTRVTQSGHCLGGCLRDCLGD